MPSSAVNKRKWAAPAPGVVANVRDVDVDEAVADVRDSDAATTKRLRVADEEEENDSGGFDVEDDDEEGRMYGGGLSTEQAHILEIMNRDVADGAEAVGLTRAFKC